MRNPPRPWTVLRDDVEFKAMVATATRTDPRLWERVKTEVTAGDKGGRPGEWSARKAQLAVQAYKKAGGGYADGKVKDNSLVQWTEEDWGTRSGRKSTETGERYLPKKARERLTPQEYKRTTEKKRRDTRKGKQFSPQPAEVAVKAARYRHTGNTGGAPGATKAELMARARERAIPGRSRMSKAELERAVGA